MMTYILIFIAKIIENCLATLRLILVANGKKMIGAILQGIVTLMWLWSTSTIIMNISDDIYKIIFFILGSFVGSYLGSFIEEKIAFGDNLLTIVLEKNKGYYIFNVFKRNFKTFILNEIDDKLIIIMSIPRKKRPKVVSLIKLIDSKAYICTLKTLLYN